jgi:hypothetical protein
MARLDYGALRDVGELPALQAESLTGALYYEFNAALDEFVAH